MDKEKLMRWSAVGIGLIISVVVLWVGLQIVSGKFGKAADLNISNFNCQADGENSMTVTWDDSSSDKGVVYFRTVGTANDLIALEDNSPQQGNGSSSHEVTLSLLTPATIYEVRVGSTGSPGTDVHQCSTKSTSGSSNDQVIPTASLPTQANTPAPTKSAKLSVSEIEDRIRDGSFKNTADCAGSTQTTALDCAKAAKALYAVQGKSVSRQ